MTKRRKKHRGGLPPNKYLAKDQVEQLKRFSKGLVNIAGERGSRRPMINDMILDLLLNSGLRAIELCSLQMRDLPYCHGKLIIDVREGKGCVQRSVEISSVLAARIKRFIKHYRRNSKPKSPLFINENGGPLSYGSLYFRIRTLGKAAGIEHLHPHMLRHTFGYSFYNHSKDLLLLGDQLGHADPKTTAIYARTANEERRRIAESFDL